MIRGKYSPNLEPLSSSTDYDNNVRIRMEPSRLSRCILERDNKTNIDIGNEQVKTLDDIELRKQRLKERKIKLKQTIIRKKNEEKEKVNDYNSYSSEQHQIALAEISMLKEKLTISNPDGKDEKEEKDNGHNSYSTNQHQIELVETSQLEGTLTNSNSDSKDHDNHQDSGNKKIMKLKKKVSKCLEKRQYLMVKRVAKMMEIMKRKQKATANVAIWKMKVEAYRKSRKEYDQTIDRNNDIVKRLREQIKEYEKDLRKGTIMLDKIRCNNDSLMQQQQRLSVTFLEIRENCDYNDSGSDHINDDRDYSSSSYSMEDFSSHSLSDDVDGFISDNAVHFIQKGNQLQDDRQKLKAQKRVLVDECCNITDKYYEMGHQRYMIQQTLAGIMKLIMKRKEKGGVKSDKLRKEINKIFDEIVEHTIQTFANVEELYGGIDRKEENFPPTEHSASSSYGDQDFSFSASSSLSFSSSFEEDDILSDSENGSC